MSVGFESLFPAYKCKKCSNTKFRPIAGSGSEKGTVLVIQCMICFDWDAFIHLKKSVSTPDKIFNAVSTLDDFDKQMQIKHEAVCPKCGTGKQFVNNISRSNRMRLDVVECNNCHFSVPIISIPRDIIYAYSHDMELAQKVVREFPEIALVFCVSALETYFRQLFRYESKLNEYLVKEKRVNFQNLKETRELLEKEFGIDIAKLVKDDWQFLLEKFDSRHRIIHHASYTKDGRKVQFSEADINKLFRIADNLVLNIEIAMLRSQ